MRKLSCFMGGEVDEPLPNLLRRRAESVGAPCDAQENAGPRKGKPLVEAVADHLEVVVAQRTVSALHIAKQNAKVKLESAIMPASLDGRICG